MSKDTIQVPKYKVWWEFQTTLGIRTSIEIPVDSVLDALNPLHTLEVKQLRDQTISWNSGGLLEYDADMLDEYEDGYVEWYDEETGMNIDEFAESMSPENYYSGLF